MPPLLLTARELAEKLDARYPEVLDWTRRGWIPAVKVGKGYVYNLASVVEAIRRRRGLGPADPPAEGSGVGEIIAPKLTADGNEGAPAGYHPGEGSMIRSRSLSRPGGGETQPCGGGLVSGHSGL